MRRANLLVLATLALSGHGASAQDAPSARPGTGQSPWNAGTNPSRPQPPAEDSTLSLRVYKEGFASGKLPHYTPGQPRRNDPAWAVDLSAVMTRCPDGNLVITALVIGGQLTPLDNRCTANAGPDRRAAPQCDANTWNCTAGPGD
jgi:hypothetical protein